MQDDILLNTRLNTFVVLCGTRNYTKAANILCITQPAVTHHIKWLQENLNVELFYYDHFHNLCLTDEGTKLLYYAQKIKADTSKLIDELQKGIADNTSLKIGTQLAPGETFIPKLIAKYVNAYPHTQISHFLGESDDLIQQLEAGDIDICIADIPCDSNHFYVRKLFNARTVCVCSNHHPLANQTVDFESLYQYRLITRSNDTYYHRNLAHTLQSNQQSIRNFKHTILIGTLSATKRLLLENVGISFLYDFAIKEELEDGSLSVISIRNFNNLQNSIDMIWLKDSMFSDRYMDFLHLCQDHIASLGFH
ncbi:LysR family transcriptional regulator [Eubacterium pyruvativorans]|uniref:LysR family transcriptional regulator n=1 Tax=Eubacterium pyruvativorans TaxID=155865 RepID=UPI000888E18D|nr:LysR family transcriptional regulator [Eubacterium pyruvativorans]SDF72805.1 DNA-binding transcriptional regulator, LysR family [Eubacterium pyruvativorans]